jgi:hypothetical protein
MHPHRCCIDACPDKQPLQACVSLWLDGCPDAQLKAAAGDDVQRQLAGVLVVSVGFWWQRLACSDVTAAGAVAAYEQVNSRVVSALLT